MKTDSSARKLHSVESPHDLPDSREGQGDLTQNIQDMREVLWGQDLGRRLDEKVDVASLDKHAEILAVLADHWDGNPAQMVSGF